MPNISYLSFSLHIAYYFLERKDTSILDEDDGYSYDGLGAVRDCGCFE